MSNPEQSAERFHNDARVFMMVIIIAAVVVGIYFGVNAIQEVEREDAMQEKLLNHSCHEDPECREWMREQW